ncbi:MAG: 50S ribosomal protein L4 [Rickettsiales bacterium]|nr:50S ribosomal protein L4 [Rickettsiales bacterium]
MKAKVIAMDGKAAGEIELNPAVFGLTPRRDILQRVVEWQRAKRQAGTHATKGRSDVSGTTKKPWKQKGSGKARAGSRRSTQWVGGGISFGPVVRSHAYDLTKKFRKLGLRHALSAKQAEGSLIILEGTAVADAKAKGLAAAITKQGWQKPLIIDVTVDVNFALASRNIKHVDVLPQVGINVYDILRHKELVLTRAAVETLEARLA